MRVKWISTAVAAAVLAGNVAVAQGRPCDRTLPGAAITRAEVCRVLSALADDSMEGRLTGSSGADRAARFVADEFRAAGLEPAGDSGFFQRVPIVMTPRPNGGAAIPRLASSFSARDTFPVASRAVAVNVIGRLVGADRVLRDSVILVGAHYDHLGVRLRPIDSDSVQAWQAQAAPIRAEMDAWFQSSGIAARAERGNPAMTDSEKATMATYSNRVAAIRVDMDSVRRAHPVPRLDSIYNGADDDASGVTAIIEIARRLAAGPRPRRTILFVAFTGEEFGLLGTRWYIEHPVVPNAALQADLQFEMIGRQDALVGGAGRAWLTGFERSTMGETFSAAALPIVPDARPGQSFFARSDNFPFAQIGVPAHTIASFGMHTDYHQLTDDLSTIDLDHLTAVINASVRAVELLANGAAPRWKPGGKP